MINQSILFRVLFAIILVLFCMGNSCTNNSMQKRKIKKKNTNICLSFITENKQELYEFQSIDSLYKISLPMNWWIDTVEIEGNHGITAIDSTLDFFNSWGISVGAIPKPDKMNDYIKEEVETINSDTVSYVTDMGIQEINSIPLYWVKYLDKNTPSKTGIISYIETSKDAIIVLNTFVFSEVDIEKKLCQLQGLITTLKLE